MKKKLLCLFLVFTLMVSMLSMTVFSEETVPEKTDPPTTTEEEIKPELEKSEEEKKTEPAEKKTDEAKQPEAADAKDQAAEPDTKAVKDNAADNSTASNAEGGQRPVWIVAHRSNTNVWDAFNNRIPKGKSEVQKAINGKCNGVEVDIRFSKLKQSLVLCHDRSLTTLASDTLKEFLDLEELRDPQMCLVIYDIKQAKYMEQIMEETHAAMDGDPGLSALRFIYSVSDLNDAEYFPDIVGQLRSNEGICVDMDWDAGADNVEVRFGQLNFDRCWYGNGIDSAVKFMKIGKVERNCKRAVEITKGAMGFPSTKKVESWTVSRNDDFKKRLINWGVDSVMVSSGIRNERVHIEEKEGEITIEEDRTRVEDLLIQCNKASKEPIVRLATRSDDPFKNLAYIPE